MVDLRNIDPKKANLDHERSRIRHLDITNVEELKRLWEIELDPLVVKFVGNISETKDDLVKFSTLDKDYLVLAVEGKVGYVDENEAGKLQGWISIYPEEKRRMVRLQKCGLSDLLKDGLRVFEIGFAKYPEARSGQIASAVRQVLTLLHDEHVKDGEHQLVVTAYTDESNETSLRVLTAAGFEHKGKVKYHLKNPNHDNFFVWQRS